MYKYKNYKDFDNDSPIKLNYLKDLRDRDSEKDSRKSLDYNRTISIERK